MPTPSREQETGGDGGDGTSSACEESKLLEKKDPLEILPVELILSIFALLSRATLAKAAQVCKRWQQIAYDPMFWREVKFHWRDKIPPGTLSSLLARGCLNLRVTNISNQIEQPMFTGRKPEESYALKRLDIEGRCKDDLCLILSRCRELTRIKTNCDDIDDDVCRKIGECPNMISVVIFKTEESTSHEGYLAILSGCRRLEEFNVHNISSSAGSQKQLNDPQLWSLINEMPPSMKKLAFLYDLDSLQDKHVELLVSKAPLLTHLELGRCPQLTGKAMEHVSRLKHLEELNVSRSMNISCEGISGLAGSKSLRMVVAIGIFTEDERTMLTQTFAGTKIYICAMARR